MRCPKQLTYSNIAIVRCLICTGMMENICHWSMDLFLADLQWAMCRGKAKLGNLPMGHVQRKEKKLGTEAFGEQSEASWLVKKISYQTPDPD